MTDHDTDADDEESREKHAIAGGSDFADRLQKALDEEDSDE